MTQSDVLNLLNAAVDQNGQSTVAKILGVSDSYISQVRKGHLPLSAVLRDKILEVYATETIACPIMGEITHAQCAEERRKPFTTSRHRQHHACRYCPRNGK